MESISKSLYSSILSLSSGAGASSYVGMVRSTLRERARRDQPASRVKPENAVLVRETSRRDGGKRR